MRCLFFKLGNKLTKKITGDIGYDSNRVCLSYSLNVSSEYIITLLVYERISFKIRVSMTKPLTPI